MNMIYHTLLECNPLHYPQDNRFKDDDLLKLHQLLARFRRRDINFVTFRHEENPDAHELREKNVDTLNKTYYESGIWSAIESRRRRAATRAAATAKFRLDFFFIARLVPISRPRPRYRVPVIISPVSLSGSIIKSLRIYLLSELRKLI